MRTANPTKTRKPYKITKPRERWNEQEHEKFLEAIDKFGRDWKQIVTFIGTRSVSQVRSHAQKHFLRLEKKGLGDVVPPARRKARWAEKRSAGLCDNPSESDQDFSVLHQQASSSSASTLEHQAMHPLLEAVHNLDGRGSSTDYSDCQPLGSRTHSLGSLASRNSSFTSPASQTEFITYAQEMLLQRQDAPVMTSAPAGNAPAFNAQPLQPEQRQFIVDMLQQLAAQQQAAGLSSAALGREGLSGNSSMQTQQRVRQLLQQHQQGGLQSGEMQGNVLPDVPLMGTHQPSVCSDTWPWRAPAPAPAAAPVSPDRLGFPCGSSSPTVAAVVNECLPAFGQQPAAPRLDGAFLAECFKSPHMAAAHNLAYQNISSQNLVSQNVPSQNYLGQNSPNASMASSTAQCYTSSSSPRLSCDSCLPAMKADNCLHTVKAASRLPAMKAEPLQHSQMTHESYAVGDALGLEDAEFWAGIGFEDPLIQAVEAAMGCTDESENSCFHMTTSGF